MMKSSEEHDPSWKLLLRSKPQQCDPFFVRNVVREVRKLGSKGQHSAWSALVPWLKRPLFAVPAATAAAAALIATLTIVQSPAPPSPNVDTALVETANGQASAVATASSPGGAAASAYDPGNTITEDLERIGYLGELVAISDPGELDDAALDDLLALR